MLTSPPETFEILHLNFLNPEISNIQSSPNLVALLESKKSLNRNPATAPQLSPGSALASNSITEVVAVPKVVTVN
jgi:hypothetical protein